jgi:serine/threonine protein kinase
MGIVHCDLKTANILLDIHDTWKVAGTVFHEFSTKFQSIDFGYSKLFENTRNLDLQTFDSLPQGAVVYMVGSMRKFQ